jgi:hydrogenase maturation protease
MVKASLPANNGQGRHVEVDCYALGGLSLMERLVGYERAIIADAMQTSDGEPGSIYCLSLDDLPDLSAGHTTSAHDTSLQTAIRLGRAMGAVLPHKILLVGIEARRVYDFSEELSLAVAAAVPKAAQIILGLLQADRTPATIKHE